MKVCKIVINSVSQDARVLKQAEAVREAGFDVIVIGIQDANNATPIQVLDNSVVIRRAAWQSVAFRPPLSFYLGQLLLLAFLGLAAAWLLYWLKDNLSWVASLVTVERAIGAAVGIVVAYFAIFIWQDYRKRKRTFQNIRKREEDELLKYDTALAVYQQPDRQTLTLRSLAKTMYAPKTVNPYRYLPRPLMGGLRGLFAPASLRRWRSVFAREKAISVLLDQERPDIIHAHDLNALPVAVRYAKRNNTKVVFDAHEIYDHLAQADDEMGELNSKLLRKYADSVDLFITINDSIARYYRRTYPQLPPAVIVKNATKRTEAFAYDGRLHEVADVSRDMRILIYQGGYAQRRGLVPLLLSAEHMNPQWSLVFMGWGRLEEELRRIADALKMKNPDLDRRIRFIPKVKQDELPYWTAGASLGAIPYENTGLNHWYCSPNKLWEYPNAGVPAIVSPFPELRGIVEAHQIGWMLPDPLEPRAIAAAVNQISPEMLETASRNCREFISKDNWSVYSDRLKTAYGGIR